ncbi:MAG: hypothetical protein E6713_03280 [Sporomusaceae bacterium]|nr:hypothetical protein [Sporomusaceae bacterium]
MNEEKMYYQSKMEEWDDMKDCCHMKKEPKFISCAPKKKCVKTFDCTFKLYRMCYYRLYKVCHACGHEYDFYQHRGTCPRCQKKFFHMHTTDLSYNEYDMD